MSAAAVLDAGAPLAAGLALGTETFERIRRRTMLEGCKWDAQVGDVATLAAFPLLIERASWGALAMHAERLAAETVTAERELVQRPELLRRLGVPRRICGELRTADLARVAAAPRSMRFDFHWTTHGWRLSEVNSDVPGGYAEASLFSELVAAEVPGHVATGRPIEAWAAAIAAARSTDGPIALLSAAGFLEDHQILAYLARRLAVHGCAARFASPAQLEWRQGEARLPESSRTPLGTVVRFYQGEWLTKHPRACWAPMFRGARTPVTNPGIALVSESKRFPLVWDSLRTPLPTWRALLPESRDPREAPWRHDDGWLVKSAFSNTGDTVSMRSLMTAREWRRIQWEVQLQPGRWVAQRRFESIPLATPRGRMHACVGVYTMNGVAAGAYARLSPKALIDFAAIDCALLVAR